MAARAGLGLTIGLFLVLALPGQGAAADALQGAPVPATSVSAADLAEQKAALARLQDQLRDRDNQLDAVKAKLDAQEAHVAGLEVGEGIAAGRFGVIVTVLGIIIGLFGVLITAVIIYFTIQTSRAAVEAAKNEARDSLEEFKRMKAEALALEAAIQDAHRKATADAQASLAEMARLVGEATRDSLRHKALIEAAERRQAPQAMGSAPSGADPDPQQALAEAARTAEAKPVAEQGFEDWYLRGLAAHDRKAYDEALEAYARAEDLAPDIASRARLLNARGRALWFSGQREPALALWQRILDTYEPLLPQHSDLAAEIAKALGNKGFALGEKGQHRDAIAISDDLLARFGAGTDLAVREQVARALRNKGVALGQLKQPDQALAIYDDLLQRFGAATELPLREQVAVACRNKAIVLGQLDRPLDAIAASDDLVARFGLAGEPSLREEVAVALNNKGVRLGELDRHEEEIAAYDDLLSRFETASEPALRDQVAGALRNKGAVLDQLGRKDEAIAVCDSLIARFDGAPEPLLQEQVAWAKAFKAQLLGA